MIPDLAAMYKLLLNEPSEDIPVWFVCPNRHQFTTTDYTTENRAGGDGFVFRATCWICGAACVKTVDGRGREVQP